MFHLRRLPVRASHNAREQAHPVAFLLRHRSPRRIQRVHRVLCRHATPLQYSVFHVIATRRKIRAMLHEIEKHIDPRRDDVRAYPLLTTARPVSLGRDRLGSGITFCHSAAPANRRPDEEGIKTQLRPWPSRPGTIPTADLVKKGLRRR